MREQQYADALKRIVTEIEEATALDDRNSQSSAQRFYQLGLRLAKIKVIAEEALK